MRIREYSNQGGQRVGYVFKCPGCTAWHRARGSSDKFTEWHLVRTEPWDRGGGEPGPVWGFSGSVESPTFSPSLLIHPDGEISHPRCHLFVVAGQIRYCADSEHPLAGKAVDMLYAGRET